MQRPTTFIATLLLIAGCGDEPGADPGAAVALDASAPQLTFTPGEGGGAGTAAPGPVTIAYRIIGTPVVDQPLGIDLQVTPNVDATEITLTFRVNDSTAMTLTESQPESVLLAPTSGNGASLQQVRVVPKRAGRVYLNVAASIEADNGSVSTVTAIPIQVIAAPRDGE